METFWYQSGWNQFQWSWPVTLLLPMLVFVGTLAGLIHCRARGNTLVTLGVIAGSLSMCMGRRIPDRVADPFHLLCPLRVRRARRHRRLVGLGGRAVEAALRFLLPAMGLVGTVLRFQGRLARIHYIIDWERS